MNIIQKVIENKNIELKHDWLSIHGQFYSVKQYIDIKPNSLNDALIIDFQSDDKEIKITIHQTETVIKHDDIIITINKGFE